MKNKTKKLRYKPLSAFSISVVRLFAKRRKVIGKPQNGECVYLCRHLSTNGVVRAFVDVKDVLAPWVLDVFCEYKSAKRQFSEYTFSKRMKKGKLFCAVFSPICARAITSISKSLCCIPVYRKDNAAKSITTIKQSVKYLEDGKKILIFPDVDYADKSQKTDGEIYSGFTAIDTLYFKRNGKHVPFVPIYVDEQKTVIHSPVFLPDSPSIDQKAEFCQKIKNGIYNA